MLPSLRMVPLFCSLLHGSAAQEEREQITLESHLDHHSRAMAERMWGCMDTDGDGMLTRGEAVNGIANILGHEPLHFKSTWDQFPKCANRKGYVWSRPHFMIHVLAELYMSVGRLDREPCLLSAVPEIQLNATMLDSTDFFTDVWSNLDFIRFGTNYFTRVCIPYEEASFQLHMDSDEDGCLSEEEWISYLTERGEEFPGNYRSQVVNVPEFSAIVQYRPPQIAMASFAEDYASACVTKHRFALWSVFSLLESIPDVAVNAPCRKEGDQTHVTVEPDRGSSDVAIILVCLLGGCSIVWLGTCAIWWHRKSRINDLAELHKIQKIMRSNIEAWSVFDSNLTAAISSLKPSFVRCLGLDGFQQDQFRFLQIVHPEHDDLVQSALTQLKHPAESESSPIARRVRLQFGARGNTDKLQEDVEYISVELSMVWDSEKESSILVGLVLLSGDIDRLSEQILVDPAPPETVSEEKEEALDTQPIMLEPILPKSNWSKKMLDPESVMPRISSRHVFRSNAMSQIAKIGEAEHWVIPKEQVIWETGNGMEGGFGVVLRGRLLYSTEVAVKMALKDDEDEVIAFACEALVHEVRLLRRMRHPNIVLFHGVVFTDGPSESKILSIVLEWVNGGNLEQHYKIRHAMNAYDANAMITSDGRFNVMNDCCLLLDIARGMVYLHALTPVILHQDLKPENVLVDNVCVPPRGKLTDFGISILIENDRDEGNTIGTAPYIAPEVREGKPFSTMVDVFSFGCIILFALTGEHPRDVDGPSFAQMYSFFISEVDALSFAQDIPSISPLLDMLVRLACMCLKVDPTLRPTFAEVFAMLAKALPNQDVCSGRIIMQGHFTTL